MRVELPDDHWAEMREPESVTAGDRRRFIAAAEMTEGGDTSKTLGAMNTLIALLVTAWDLGPLPAQYPDVLDELSMPVYDALLGAAAPAAKYLRGTDFGVDIDPESPTKPSRDTEPSEKASSSARATGSRPTSRASDSAS